MTRIPYDQTAKKLLDGVLERAGRAETQREVSTDPQHIDVWFERDEAKPRPPGTLGRMLAESCAFEVFHAAPRLANALDCLAKQLGVYRRRRRRSRNSSTEVSPMWLLTTARPRVVLDKMLARKLEAWPTGFYRMAAPALPLYLVCLRELPRTRETVLLRLMGAKTLLRDAIEDLNALPRGAWERVDATDAVAMLRSLTRRAGRISDPEERAIVMSAAATYERIKEEGRKQGRKQGRKEGGRAFLVRMLARRFGDLPSAVVARVEAADDRQLDRWVDRAVTATTLNEVFGRERRASRPTRVAKR